MDLARPAEISLIEEYRSLFPVVGLVGPRQCGKTTLAKSLKPNALFDLEDPRDYQLLQEPMLALEHLEGLIIIDEVQLAPDLFPILRVLVDRDSNAERRQFLILGSASPALIQSSSESLAGRIGNMEMGGFRQSDLPAEDWRKLWLRGGLPRSYLASSNKASMIWLENYVRTFLERDLAALGFDLPTASIRQFWEMLAHNHGGILNLAELARSFGKSETTVKRYAHMLEDALMIRLLRPWHKNMGKRLVQRPKIYLRDSGVLHRLLNIVSEKGLQGHMKLGASWEGFALEQIIRQLEPHIQQFYFWATHSGAELDLLWEDGGKLYGIEFKYGDAPKMTRSMRSALESLELKKMWVICPAGRSYYLDEKVEVVPLGEWELTHLC